MTPRFRIIFALLVVCLAAGSRPGRSGDGFVVKSDPKHYSYRGSTRVERAQDPDKGVVLYMAYPESDAFQTVRPAQSTPGELVPIPGNEFDKCLRVHLKGDDLRPGRGVTVFHEFIVTLYDIEIDFSKITDLKPYDTGSALYRRYTGADDSPLISPTHPEIQQAAKELSERTDGFLEFAREAFLWAKKNKLKDPFAEGFSAYRQGGRAPGLMGSNPVFISLLRSAGIPARPVVGRGTDGAVRTWSEFYLEGYGWIPANPGAKNERGQAADHYFGRMSYPNRYGIVARSVAMNHVLGENELPVPVEGEPPIQYNTLPHYVLWGAPDGYEYDLAMKPLRLNADVYFRGGAEAGEGAKEPALPPAGLRFEKQAKYTVYIGVNDRETRRPVMPLAEARVLLNAICLKHVGGFTVSEAQGHWIDGQGKPVYEESLVYVFVGADEDAVRPMLDEMLAAMKQASVLVEKDELPVSFYAGPGR